MIKELNYYLYTNRFSEIAEELDNSIREYGDSWSLNKSGDSELREKARLLCEKHLIESGIRSENNSFINIDAEFFDNGELIESNLNKFIKEIIKAHCYQKILWEYMGTTGLMTEVSKSAMEADGFRYEKFLPIKIREKEIKKSKNRTTRNFNSLKDNSGFDWTKGYDPNYSVEKNGWIGAFNQDKVWTYYETKDLPAGSKKIEQKGIYKIQLIRTEHGCMLYDMENVLLNPIILWYLLQNNDVYGGEQSDTNKIIDDIRRQMTVLGVEKITQIAVPAVSNKSKEIIKEYSKLLGDLLAEDVNLITNKAADEEIINSKKIEKSLIIENKSVELQKRIAAIVNAKNNITNEELKFALETGKLSVDLDINKYEDSVLAGLEDTEYKLFKELYNKLNKEKSEIFKRNVLSLSSYWDNYISCGLTKQECIQNIYNYIEKNEEIEFSYETSLKEIINSNDIPIEKIETIDIRSSLEKIIRETVPEENKSAFIEYISELPEQKIEVKAKVYVSLLNAIYNYLAIRSSTGMSIKELFDYAIKVNGGTLPKSSFEPPVIGYVSQGMMQKNNLGEKRIFFEKKVSELVEELSNKTIPTKEVNVFELEKNYEKLTSEKPVILIGKNRSSEESMVYDFGNEIFTNSEVTELFKNLVVKKEEIKKQESESGVTDKNEIIIRQYQKIRKLAVDAETPEKFIQKLQEEFNIEYNLTNSLARKIFEEKYNGTITEDVLVDYTEEFEKYAETQLSNPEYVYENIQEITPSFKQIKIAEKEEKKESKEAENVIQLPKGLKIMENKTSPAGVVEQVTIIEARKKTIERFTDTRENWAKTAETLEKAERLSPTEKIEVAAMIKNLSETEKLELMHSAGNDWNYITPLLVKEYLWRKKNGKSVKGLVQQIVGLEGLKNIEEKDLQTLLASSAVNGEVKNIEINREHFETFIEAREEYVPENNENIETVPVIKLNGIQKEHFKQVYGIDTKSFSPIIRSYIHSGAWKNIPKERFTYNETYGFTTINTINKPNNSPNVEKEYVFGSSYSFGRDIREDAVFGKKVNANSSETGIGTEMRGSITKKGADEKIENNEYWFRPDEDSVHESVRISTGTSSHEHVKINESRPMSEDLKKTIQIAAEKRTQNSEMSKMSRMNANYEHDKAVLAKNDPVFAKNQFWDVGHAEGDGELSERDIRKIENSIVDSLKKTLL